MKSLNFLTLILFYSSIIFNKSHGLNGTQLLEYAIKQYSKLVKTVQIGAEYPTFGIPVEEKWHSRLTNNGFYFEQGMFPGVLWYLYKYTGDNEWKNYAIKATDGLNKAKTMNTSHDIGFVIIQSYDNGYKFTHNSSYVDVIKTGAETLASRFNEKVGCTRSWNSKDPEDFIVIADNMMNLELLFRGWQLTGNKTYYDMAVSHANRTIKEHIRSDNSSNQVVEFNSTTGEVIRKRTQQGWSDSSCWSRGQAWLVAGLTIAYRYTKLEHILQAAERVSKYFIDHLPEDNVPFFDFTVPKNALHYMPKDTSSAAIASSGLLELHAFTNNTLYLKTASKMIESLFDHYRADGKPEYKLPALLANGTYYYKSNFDIATSYGDYYFAKCIQYYL